MKNKNKQKSVEFSEKQFNALRNTTMYICDKQNTPLEKAGVRITSDEKGNAYFIDDNGNYYRIEDIDEKVEKLADEAGTDVITMKVVDENEKKLKVKVKYTQPVKDDKAFYKTGFWRGVTKMLKGVVVGVVTLVVVSVSAHFFTGKNFTAEPVQNTPTENSETVDDVQTEKVVSSIDVTNKDLAKALAGVIADETGKEVASSDIEVASYNVEPNVDDGTFTSSFVVKYEEKLYEIEATGGLLEVTSEVNEEKASDYYITTQTVTNAIENNSKVAATYSSLASKMSETNAEAIYNNYLTYYTADLTDAGTITDDTVNDVYISDSRTSGTDSLYVYDVKVTTDNGNTLDGTVKSNKTVSKTSSDIINNKLSEHGATLEEGTKIYDSTVKIEITTESSAEAESNAEDQGMATN